MGEKHALSRSSSKLEHCSLLLEREARALTQGSRLFRTGTVEQLLAETADDAPAATDL